MGKKSQIIYSKYACHLDVTDEPTQDKQASLIYIIENNERLFLV